MDARDLEALIVAVATGSRPRADLLAALSASRVAVLFDRGLEDGAFSPEARPLTLNSPDGYPVLAVFTSVEKAGPWVKNEPSFRHALVTDFAWAVGIVPAGFGLGLNSGYQWSLLLAPDDVRDLKGAS